MQHYFDALIKDLKQDIIGLEENALARPLERDEYVRMVGQHHALSRMLVRVESDYNNWRQGQ